MEHVIVGEPDSGSASRKFLVTVCPSHGFPYSNKGRFNNATYWQNRSLCDPLHVSLLLDLRNSGIGGGAEVR